MNETTAITMTTTTSKVIISEITTTSTATQSHEVVLPTLYTPLTSRASSTYYIDQDNTETFTVKVFTTLSTSTTASITIPLFTTTYTTTAKYDPNAVLPPSFNPLSTRAPRLLTSSTTTISQTQTATAQSLDKDQHGNSLSSGQLAGIIIGSILGGLLLLYIFYVLCWSRRKMMRSRKIGRIPSNNNEKYAESIHLPYHFNYPNPTHQESPAFYIPDESIVSHDERKMYY